MTLWICGHEEKEAVIVIGMEVKFISSVFEQGIRRAQYPPKSVFEAISVDFFSFGNGHQRSIRLHQRFHGFFHDFS